LRVPLWVSPESPAQLGVVAPEAPTVEQAVFQHQVPAGRVVRTLKVLAEEPPGTPSQKPACWKQFGSVHELGAGGVEPQATLR
jgi:hypothetical protein